MKKFIAFILLSSFLACTKVVDVSLGDGEIQVTIDGNVVYDPEDPTKIKKDTIQVKYTTAYLAKNAPPMISGATLVLSDNAGSVETLTGVAPGKYVVMNTIPQMGYTYTLDITLPNGDKYKASSKINRLSVFDSLSVRDTSRLSNLPGGPIAKGVYVKLYAYDLPGAGDAYRLKTYVKRKDTVNSPYRPLATEPVVNRYGNWKTLTDPVNLNLCVDAASAKFSTTPVPDLSNTRTKFTLPVEVFTVNNIQDKATSQPSYFPGDSLQLEIYSLTFDHLKFWVSLFNEITNGTGGGLNPLFSTPQTNLPTNVFGVNTDKVATGWFGAVGVVRKKIKIKNFEFKTGQTGQDQ
jgi:hypothetical protein